MSLSDKKIAICITCTGICNTKDHVMYPHEEIKEAIKELKEELNWRIERWRKECSDSKALFEVVKTIEEIRDVLIDKIFGDALVNKSERGFK